MQLKSLDLDDAFDETERRLCALETPPPSEDLPYPALLENERSRFAAVMAENTSMRIVVKRQEKEIAELQKALEQPFFHGKSAKEWFGAYADLQMQFGELKRLSELGAAVEAIPKGSELRRQYKDWYFRKDCDVAGITRSTAIEVLHASGIMTQQQKTDPEIKTWKCPNCGDLNHYYLLTCMECKTKRPLPSENIEGMASDDGLKVPTTAFETELASQREARK